MSTPFDRPEIRMERVTLPELHRMILQRTCKGYMPFTHQDAVVEQLRPLHNSKPEYIGYNTGLGQLTFEQFRDAASSWGSSGYFARSDMGTEERAIYAVLYLAKQRCVLFVNLTSLDTYYGEWQGQAHGELKWWPWPHLQYLAIDRVELSQQIEQL
jgi:hypothetical protein